MRRVWLLLALVVLCWAPAASAQNCVTQNGVFTCNLTASFTRVKVGDGSASAPSYTFASDPTTGFYRSASGNVSLTVGANDIWRVSSSGLFLSQGSLFGWGSSGTSSTDTFLAREAANYAIQRNGTNAQRWDVCNTWTSTTNKECAGIDWQTNANVAIIGARTGATGTGRRALFSVQGDSGANSYAGISVNRNTAPLIRIGLYQSDGVSTSATTAAEVVRLAEFTNTASTGLITPVTITPVYNQTGGSTAANTDFLINRTQTAVGSGTQNLLDAQADNNSKFAVRTSGAFGGGTTTVASLPTCNAALKGFRLFVTDANATTFWSTVAAGGSNNVPVTCDGTNWKIG